MCGIRPDACTVALRLDSCCHTPIFSGPGPLTSFARGKTTRRLFILGFSGGLVACSGAPCGGAGPLPLLPGVGIRGATDPPLGPRLVPVLLLVLLVLLLLLLLLLLQLQTLDEREGIRRSIKPWTFFTIVFVRLCAKKSESFELSSLAAPPMEAQCPIAAMSA